MRRAANLFDRICEPENLRLAFNKAARGRRGQAVVRQFAAGLDDRISEMAKAIYDGTFPVGRFHQFLIRDPKERVITAPCFDERVLHHAIMNLCEPVLDRWLIDDTFACRSGKGREAAVHRAQHFSRNATWYKRRLHGTCHTGLWPLRTLRRSSRSLATPIGHWRRQPVLRQDKTTCFSGSADSQHQRPAPTSRPLATAKNLPTQLCCSECRRRRLLLMRMPGMAIPSMP